MMFKVSFYLMLMTLILGCDSAKKKESITSNSMNMSVTEILNTIECQDKIRSFGLAENTLSDFFYEITHNENFIKKVDLIFYREEGEVISLYKAGIVQYENSSKVFYSLNSNDIEVDSIDNSEILNSLMDKIKELRTPTNRKILLIDINDSKSSCKLFKDIEPIETSGNKILF